MQTAVPVPVVHRSGFALASAILGTVAVLVCWIYAVGSALLSAGIYGMVAQFGVLAVAVVCNWVGYATRTRGLVLAAAILYCVACVLYLSLMFLILLPLIFAFVGYAKMRPR